MNGRQLQHASPRRAHPLTPSKGLRSQVMAIRLTLLTALCAVVASFYTPTEGRAVRRASSSVTLPFARRLNTTGIPNLLAVDQARAKALKARATSGAQGLKAPMALAADVPATNQVVDYVATVCVIVSLHAR